MRDLTEERGISFFVAVVPLFRLGREHRESFSNYHIADLHGHIDEFLRSEGIAHLDLLDAFRDLGVPATSLADDPWHPNPAGHEVITEHLTRALLEEAPALAASR
jgi:lysophospholipase L1-like esterase